MAVDGMEWNAVLPLLRQGRMPALAGLLRRGSYGLLETRASFVSPALWTSVATGKEVEKHGIRDFLKAQKPAVFYASSDRRTKAFWNILSERGRRVHTVGWFVTYPVERINGVMVAQTNTGDFMKTYHLKKGSLIPGLDRQVYPPERQEELLEIAAAADAEVPALLEDRVGAPIESLRPQVRRPLETTGWAMRADTIYRRIALRLLEREPAPDLLAVYFCSLDVVSHHFWPYVKPRGPLSWVSRTRARELAPRFAPGSLANRLFGGWYWPLLEPHSFPGAGPIVSRSYEALDAALAELLARMPRQASVIVMSDHGMRPWGHSEGPHALFVAAGPGIRRMEGPAPEKLARQRLRVLGSILDVTPTLLTLLEVPLGRDMDGRPLEAVLQPAFPDRPRPEPVPSHDTPEWLAARAAEAGAAPAQADAERLEQLRALGYIQ